MQHISLLKKSINFINNGKITGSDTSIDPNFFLASWGESIGFINLKNLAKQKIPLINKFKIIFKELIAAKTHKLNIYHLPKNKKFESLVFSYFIPENLKKDGNYFDKYFAVKTKNWKKILWVFIPLKHHSQKFKTLDNTIILNRNTKKGLVLYFLIFFKSLIIFFSNLLFNADLTFKNQKINFSTDFFNIINKLVKLYKIKKIIYPYEGQPHQTYLNKKIKFLYPKLKIIGYMHTAIPPLPLDYIKKECEPDILYVNGYAQKQILIKHFGWPSKKIINIISMRYAKSPKNKMFKKIFLPYYLEDESKFFNLFQTLIYSKPKFYFPVFKIKNHPSMEFSKTHKRLIKKINAFLKVNKNYFKNHKLNKEKSIFLGSSAAILEALERKVQVYHICSDVIFEKFDNFYWKDIKVEDIAQNIFKYKLLSQGKLIKLGENKNLFAKITK